MRGWEIENEIITYKQNIMEPKKHELSSSPSLARVVLYAVSIVCDKMKNESGESIPTDKYLPVFDTIEEARAVIKQRGFGQLIELTKDGL